MSLIYRTSTCTCFSFRAAVFFICDGSSCFRFGVCKLTKTQDRIEVRVQDASITLMGKVDWAYQRLGGAPPEKRGMG